MSVVLFLSNAALLAPAVIIKLTRRLEIGIREGVATGNKGCTVLTDREEDLAACSVLGQLAWLAAILWKEMHAAVCTSATPAATPGSEGGEEFCLPLCKATT
jgi:hypothetical protein